MSYRPAHSQNQFPCRGPWQGNGREKCRAVILRQHNLRFSAMMATWGRTQPVAISRRLHKLRSELQETQP